MTSFESAFWSDESLWPLNFAGPFAEGLYLTYDHVSLVFLGRAIVRVADLLDQQMPLPARLERAAARIAQACIAGDMRSYERRKVGGKTYGLSAREWRRIDEIKTLQKVLATCTLNEGGSAESWVYVPEPALERLCDHIQPARSAETRVADPEPWRRRPNEAQKAWILRPEVRAEAEKRASATSGAKLARAYESMTRPESEWKAVTLAVAMRTSGQFPNNSRR